MTWFCSVVGSALAGLLGVAWWIDRGVRTRGSRVLHHSDIWYEVRESRRDAELMNPLTDDQSWTSWSRRNRR